MGPKANSAPSRRRLWLIVIVALLATSAGSVGVVRFWSTRNKRTAARIVEDGVQAWRNGDLRRAELSFETARALDGSTLRPIILEARLLMRQGKKDSARELFRETLRKSTGPERAGAVVAYHDALTAVGWWDERARLAIDELKRNGAANVILLTSAIESVRLASWSAAEIGAFDADLDPISSALLRAQAQINRDDSAAARATLQNLPRSLSPMVSLLACRVCLRAGDREQSRVLLARADHLLDETHVLLGLVLMAGDEPDQARAAVRSICRAGSLGTKSGSALEALLAQLWSFPDQAIADELTTALAPSRRALDPSLVASLWLYCSVSNASADTAIWADELGRRSNVWPINLLGAKLDEKVALFAINTLPLNRYLADGLIAAAANAAPPIRTASR